MSDQLHDDQVEEIEQEEELREENLESEEEESPEDEDDDGVIVTIGDEKPPVEDEEEKTAPKWVKDLRKQTKEQAKRIRELEAERAANVAPTAKTPELGPKPTLDDCDYDADEFELKLTEWHDRKRQVEQAKVEADKQVQAQQEEWQGRLSTYAKAKEALKVRDFDEAESNILGALDVTQQGIIVQGADNSALVVYALGKNAAKAKELAAIKDPVKFAFAIAKLETQLKVQAKKSAPAPERTVSGSAPKSGAVDSSLERLREEAAKTGDYSKVSKYKADQKRKAQG